ncbi:MAG: DUF4258 domain-containing protein [Bacteroidota bacterium]|nr:DUF4258 domain-containing protein [Bacteroidota bacterium]
MNDIIFSKHSEMQMLLRGASKDDVIRTINEGHKETAKLNKLHSTLRFDFNSNSPVNNKYYEFKTIDVIFVEENNQIIIVTVKVYYH